MRRTIVYSSHFRYCSGKAARDERPPLQDLDPGCQAPGLLVRLKVEHYEESLHIAIVINNQIDLAYVGQKV